MILGIMSNFDSGIVDSYILCKLYRTASWILWRLLRWVYWTDAELSRVYKAAMDGSRVQVVERQGLAWPNALCLDLPATKLYWMDAKTNLLERYNLNTAHRKVSF